MMATLAYRPGSYFAPENVHWRSRDDALMQRVQAAETTAPQRDADQVALWRKELQRINDAPVNEDR